MQTLGGDPQAAYLRRPLPRSATRQGSPWPARRAGCCRIIFLGLGAGIAYAGLLAWSLWGEPLGRGKGLSLVADGPAAGSPVLDRGGRSSPHAMVASPGLGAEASLLGTDCIGRAGDCDRRGSGLAESRVHQPEPKGRSRPAYAVGLRPRPASGPHSRVVLARFLRHHRPGKPQVGSGCCHRPTIIKFGWNRSTWVDSPYALALRQPA